ncbi:MAG TPA: DUF2158 domain-containing protein [Sulfurovum sp.]|nr:DUF2158 domain-containing protein [Sulfurovum sp.]
MSNFKVGDLVQLKSGGPVMTIKEISGAESILCVWFKDVELVSDNFFQETLEIFKAIEF